MKIKNGYITRPMGDMHIVVDVDADVDFNGLITLNSSGLFIWDMLQNEISFDELLMALCEKYDAPKDVLKADLEEFIKKAEEADLMEKQV